MSRADLVLTAQAARGLVVTAQRLAGPRPRPDADGILETVRTLGYLQMDPTNVVARSPLLVLWSRLGSYDPADLDRLLWQERRLFEYRALIVPTEAYAIFKTRMRWFATDDRGWSRKVRAFLNGNTALRRHILAELRRRGPLPSDHFEDRATAGWQSTGWTSGRNMSQMLEFLAARGAIMVAGRRDGRRLWDLADRCLPDWSARKALPLWEAARQAAERALRGLGVARAGEIRNHYVGPRRLEMGPLLADLASRGRIVPVRIEDGRDGRRTWPGRWYVHTDVLPLLDRLAGDDWGPRTTLLSPFDNLIINRARTERLFGFRYRMEIYVPQARRRYGYFVMPILHGDRLIGRVDPALDRAARTLEIRALHVEPGVVVTPEIRKDVAAALRGLAAFLRARDVACGQRVPSSWRAALS